mgnify:FL=1
MNYYEEIKRELINNEVYKRVKDYSKNRSDLNTYYMVGKLLSEAGKSYGEGIIKKYSIRLTKELGRGYTPTRLRYFRRFFNVFSKCPTMSDKLSYSHYCEIIWLDGDMMKYYIKIAEEQNLSVRKLREKIKNKEYERLDEEAKHKLIENKETSCYDVIKNPILIKNKYNTDEITEKMLQDLILEDIPGFLSELGEGFSFIKNEYPIKIGNRYNYIDMLLFNINDNKYVVLELKVTELKKEHIGQISVYMNYIDNNLKKSGQNPTMGIIICKKNNKFIMKYVTDNKILEREYKFI